MTLNQLSTLYGFFFTYFFSSFFLFFFLYIRPVQYYFMAINWKRRQRRAACHHRENEAMYTAHSADEYRSTTICIISVGETFGSHVSARRTKHRENNLVNSSACVRFFLSYFFFFFVCVFSRGFCSLRGRG